MSGWSDARQLLRSNRSSDRFPYETPPSSRPTAANTCTLHDTGPDYMILQYIEGMTSFAAEAAVCPGPITFVHAKPSARQRVRASRPNTSSL